MKNLLSVFILAVGQLLGQQKQTNPQLIVVGSCLINADYKPGDKALLQFNNQFISETIDSINKKTVFNLLVKAGVDSTKILYTAGFGSSIVGRIELFFVYSGTISSDMDIWVWTGHDRIAGGYAQQNKLNVPQFQLINKPELESVCAQLVKNFPLFTFACKPFNLWWAPYIIIAMGTKGGELIDMRTIDYSGELVEAFKRAGWNRIIYRNGTDPKYKMVVKQANGTYSLPK